MPKTTSHVFVNCPFDKAFQPLFEAIIFTITACGYQPRCALEDEDGADIRLDKLCRIIGECPRSVHDLSRTQTGDAGLPRFNMPFELGLTIGAKKYGGAKRSNYTAAILVTDPFKLPAYLSDLGGNDPRAHHDDVANVVKIVRNYLGKGPSGTRLPGPAILLKRLEEFQHAIPAMASEHGIGADELDAFNAYPDYAYFLSEYLKAAPIVPS